MIIKKCRDCGVEANTEEELLLFATDKSLTFGRKNYCKVCHSKASTKRCLEYRKDNKQKIREYLGGVLKCEDCGIENDYLGMFDWHHLDSTTKEIGVSRILAHSWERVKKEIDKCIFLCANCHRLRHR